MATTQYIGARYVPRHMGEWDINTQYGALDVVLYTDGNSYTAKCYPPKGTPPTNAQYWALSGQFNQQLADVDAKATGKISKEYIKTLYSYEGDTPEEKLKNALYSETNCVILIPEIELTVKYVPQENKDYRKITLYGGTVHLKVNEWFSTTNNGFCPSFVCCNIIGYNNNYMFGGLARVGARFIGCFLQNVGVYNTSTYIQSPYFENCQITTTVNMVIAEQVYDLKFTGNRVESASGTLFNIVGKSGGICVSQGAITDNLVEGQVNIPFIFGSCFALKISGNYFEQNNLGTIKFTKQGSDVNSLSVNIESNAFYYSSQTGTQIVFDGFTAGSAGERVIRSNCCNPANNQYLMSARPSDNPFNYSGNYATSGNIRDRLFDKTTTKNIEQFVVNGGSPKWVTDHWEIDYIIPGQFYTTAYPMLLSCAGQFSVSAHYQGFCVAVVSPYTKFDSTVKNAVGTGILMPGNNGVLRVAPDRQIISCGFLLPRDVGKGISENFCHYNTSFQ